MIDWLIDGILLEKHDTGFPTLAEAASNAGHNVILTRYIPFSTSVSNDVDQFIYERQTVLNKPLVAYGCTGFLKQLVKNPYYKFSCPGAYFKIDELKYSVYSSQWGEYMFNEDYIMLPYGELKRRIDEDIHEGRRPPHFKSHRLFVRPDVVTKSFAGRLFDFDTFEDSIRSIVQYEPIDDRELCIIASEKEIIAEFRHIVCDREVITGSQYRRDGKLDIRSDVDEDCHRLAQQVAEKEDMDYVYVVDTALTEDGPRIMEFNAFSCSGLYACDTNIIVDKVGKMAIKELKGDL